MCVLIFIYIYVGYIYKHKFVDNLYVHTNITTNLYTKPSLLAHIP